MVPYATGVHPSIDRRVVIALATLARIGTLRNKVCRDILAGNCTTQYFGLAVGLPHARAVLTLRTRLELKPRPHLTYTALLRAADPHLQHMIVRTLQASRHVHDIRTTHYVLSFKLDLPPLCEALLQRND